MVAEEGEKHPLDSTRLQIIVQVGIIGHAYGTSLLTDYDNHSIRLLSHTQGCPVTGAETLLDIRLLTEGQITTSSNNPSVLNDHGTIM